MDILKVSKLCNSRNVLLCANTLKYCTSFQEMKRNVNGVNINYIKVGKGDKNVLCCPGALGSIWSDFKPQIEGLDQNKFTLVALDPAGYGKSRPPDRKFTTNFYVDDAKIAYNLMRDLGIKEYSLLGWSDGGISGMILAALYPDVINKLVIWGSNAYILPEEVEVYNKLRDLTKWSDKMKAPLVALYGIDGFEKLWHGWCDIVSQMFKEGGDICKTYLKDVKCPTLILHGDKDPMVAPEHPIFLLEKIKNSRLHRFPDGKHNIHLRYSKEFNSIVTAFLEEQNIESKI